MKRRIIFWLLAGFFMASCHKDPVQPPLPEISIDKSSLEEFSYQAGSSQDVILKVNRDWTIQCSADWLAFDYDAGPVTVGQMKEITVTITPLTNRVGNVRSAVVRFKTSTKYADLHVSQASHPDNAPELIYYNSFGEDLQGLDNPLIQNTDIWRVEEGVAEDFVYFSDANSTKKISVRNSSTSNSSLGAGSDCYMGASGGNHIFFGTQNPYFTLGNIEVHPKLTMINVSFGVYNINGVKVDTSDFPVYISKDGESWIPLNYKIVSEYDEPKWCLCKAEIYFPASSFDRLFIRFTPGTASVYRFDDLRIGSDLNAVTPEDGEIDWTNGAVEMDKGNEVTAG